MGSIKYGVHRIYSVGIYIVLISCVPLLVSGCLETEGVSVALDLQKNTCTVIYYGLGSDGDGEVEIEEDFKSLIELYNLYRSDKSGNLLLVELYPEGNRLNGKIVFRFNETFLTSDAREYLTLDLQENLTSDLRDDLEDFILSLREPCKLKVDKESYFILWSDSDENDVKGNGEIVQEGLKKKMKWPKIAKLIQYKALKPVESGGDKIKNFLLRWQSLSKQHQAGQKNAVKSEKETIK